MKAHSETHFENENMFLENGKVIYPFLKKKCSLAYFQRNDWSHSHNVEITQNIQQSGARRKSFTVKITQNAAQL